VFRVSESHIVTYKCRQKINQGSSPVSCWLFFNFR